MANKQGTNQIVDAFIGDKLIEARYAGAIKYFDAYTEITGTLPLSFNSRVTGALKNYRVYGTENGAGVQTINLLDVNARDTANGYIHNAYLTYQGAEMESNNYDVSEYIPILAETDYSIIARKINSPGCCFYDATKQFISGIRYSNLRPRNFTTPTGAAYFRMTITRYGVGSDEGGEDMLLLGNYSEQPDFEPYGYKIPFTLTSGQNSDNYTVYFGGTQIGEEEYVDYQEQKVYKRTENLWNPEMEVLSRSIIKSSGSTGGGYAAYSVSDYIPMEAEKAYIVSPVTTIANASAYHAFYDSNKEVIDVIQIGSANQSKTFTTPANCAYMRFTFREETVPVNTIMLVQGNTLPETFIPYLQPTDPPAPLQAITAYQGENTLSSTETLGVVTVKGRISAISP